MTHCCPEAPSDIRWPSIRRPSAAAATSGSVRFPTAAPAPTSLESESEQRWIELGDVLQELVSRHRSDLKNSQLATECLPKRLQGTRLLHARQRPHDRTPIQVRAVIVPRLRTESTGHTTVAQAIRSSCWCDYVIPVVNAEDKRVQLPDLATNFGWRASRALRLVAPLDLGTVDSTCRVHLGVCSSKAAADKMLDVFPAVGADYPDVLGRFHHDRPRSSLRLPSTRPSETAACGRQMAGHPDLATRCTTSAQGSGPDVAN